MGERSPLAGFLALLLAALAFAACLPRWTIDPAVPASVAPIALGKRPDGAIAIADWVLVDATPPGPVERESDRRVTVETRAALTLRAADGALWKGDCKLDGGDGGVWLEAHWTLECVFLAGEERHELSLAGRGGDSLFDAPQITGTVISRGHQTGPRGDELTCRGTMREMTFYRTRRDEGFAPRVLAPVAAVTLGSEGALYLTPELDAALRVEVMLGVGTLVSLREAR